MFLVIPYFFIELYMSLKTGEVIGFGWSVVWIMLSFLLGIVLLKNASKPMMTNMQSVKSGKLDVKKFKDASISYFIGSILLIIPGVFSDMLGLLLLLYTIYLQFIAKITPEQTKNYKKQGDDHVIDVEIID